MQRTENQLGLAELLEAGKSASNEADAAIAIARELLIRSQELQTPQERRQQAELDRMIAHPGDKATLVEMTDQAFRTDSPARVADQLTHILDVQGIPRFFSPLEQTMLRGFQTFGGYLPGVAVPLVKDKMRQETANVILPAEEQPLREHLGARQTSGLQMNVNFLGEALLGEHEAERRLQNYLQSLQIPEIACISVKLTTIFSQVSTLARRQTIDVVADRMELLYRAAMREKYVDSDGQSSSKFVYLDMEEYRDLHLTADVFCTTLDRAGLQQARAGIALQAYVPDSFGVLQQLIEWSANRVAGGAVPITIRLVKGANMEMERVEASLGGYPQTPYTRKVETDANFKRMLRSMIDAAAKGIIQIGVASHNLFDISLALLWGERTKLAADPSRNVLEAMQFEMLEGMANHQRRALFEPAPKMLLYAPACRREDFLNAIGYLIRRLDENTGEENFLRHSFRLTPDSEIWTSLAEDFRQSLESIDTVSAKPRRTQDRRSAPEQLEATHHWSDFKGESDTDWAMEHHSEWASSIIENWMPRSGDNATQIPLYVGTQQREGGDRNVRSSEDPSRPGVAACRFTEATVQDVEDAIALADADPTGWRKLSWQEREPFFRSAAQKLRERRGDLIGAMMIDGGKLVTEADPELSEAVDFTEFYPLTAKDYFERAKSAGLRMRPRGVVAVISPWNFPLAIPCGGIVSALAAGNTVILKPASDTVLPAYEMAKCFWDAGVPREVLQVIPCRGGGAGQRLVTDPRVQAVILTGGTETAQQMLRLRSDLRLIAETGGKNATIVTSLSDRDLAIKHVLHSAFSHSGQKCSATSLLLLSQELYDDPKFRESLADAAESLPVGSAWDLKSRVGPLIRPPSGELAQGLMELESGEEWLLMPKRVGNNPQLWRPGIKWNVRPGSFTHRTELFGPVLGVMRFGTLEEAIQRVGETGYGLTSGLESLDDREQQLWKETIHAGNLYINRPTTGAVVLRQPFGGIGRSAYGPGAKAGGPHYVLPLLAIENDDETEFESKTPTTEVTLAGSRSVFDAQRVLAELPDHAASLDHQRLHRFAVDIATVAEELFGTTHDHFHLVGQDNQRRYLPMKQLRVRLMGDESLDDVCVMLLAAIASQSRTTFSFAKRSPAAELIELFCERWPSTTKQQLMCEWLEESDEALAAAIADQQVDRLRVLTEKSKVSATIHAACREAFVSLIDEPVIDDGEIEGLRFLVEQSISHDFHRYGNLGRRGNSSGSRQGVA
ncbi:MAG: proline dehydrogenase family protein [Planctomycetota bacterium]